MASERLNKRHASVKRPRESSSLSAASLRLDDSSYISPLPTTTPSSRAHHPSSRAARPLLPLSSPASSSSSHSVHRGRMKADSDPPFHTPTRNRTSSSPATSTSDPNTSLVECHRCSHLFPSAARLHAHHQRKQKCHPHDHLRSPQSSPTSSSSSSTSPLSSSPTHPTRRWLRHSRTGLPRFNADLYTLTLHTHSPDSIRLRVTPRQHSPRLDPSRLSSDYVTHANECLTLKLIRLESELLHEFGSFHPSFTHQLFPDEDIVGYKKLQVHLDFTASSLFAHISVTFEDKLKQGSDDVFHQIASKLPLDAYTTDVDVFKQVSVGHCSSFSLPVSTVGVVLTLCCVWCE